MHTMNTDYTMSETQLQQALAANERLMTAIEREELDRRKTRKVLIACAVVYLVCTLLVVGFLGVLAAGITVEVETTEEQTVEGDSAIINNGNFNTGKETE